MDPLGDPLITRPIRTGWEFAIEPYPNWRFGFIDDPDRQFGNGSGWTRTRTRTDGPEPLLTLVTQDRKQKSLTLGWPSFSEWGSACVAVSCAYKGCPHVSYTEQQPNHFSITVLTRLIIGDPHLQVVSFWYLLPSVIALVSIWRYWLPLCLIETRPYGKPSPVIFWHWSLSFY